MIHDPVMTIGNMIDHQELAFIGSVDSNGFPTMKAMLAPQKRIGLRTFYFTTSCDAKRTQEYRENPKGCIYFYDPTFFRGVMFQGTVEVIVASEIKEDFWKPENEGYFVNGKKDPNFCVLKFTIDKGRYFSNEKVDDFEVSEE